MADLPSTEIRDTMTGEDVGRRSDDVYVFPASFGQRRLWFLDQFEPMSPYYNIPTAYRLHGPFRIDVFRRAMQEIVDRHEALRTTLVAIDGQPKQVVSPGGAAAIGYDDLQVLPEADREVEASRRVLSEAQMPFDLARGPLLRCRVLRLEANEHIILITMHHIISDGWSIGVMMDELTTLYAAFQEGRPSPLAPLPIQYPDFAQWQQEWFQGNVLERQLSYWKKQLADSPELLEIPTDRPRPPVYTNVGNTLSVLYGKELLDALGTLGKCEGATLYMVLLAAFQTLLYRYSGQEENCVGTPIANRTQADLEKLIGLFINTLVIRTKFSDDPTFRKLVHRVRETLLDAYAHQDLPFEMLLEALQLDRDMSHTPLFQVMFILQNTPSTVQILPGVTLSAVEPKMGTATYDMTWSLSESRDGLHVAVEYNTDLFDETTIKRLVLHYENLLRAIVRSPDMRVSRLPMLSGEEVHQQLVGWSGTREEFRNVCVHDLVRERAAQNPDAIAVVAGAEHCTYHTLEERVCDLARFLRDRDIGPECRVAICMEKSVDMIVAVLGVLESGGAYVPLDPLQPCERLSFMLRDSQSRILLTQEEVLDNLPEFPGEIICVRRDWKQIVREGSDHRDVDVDPDSLAYLIYTSGTTGLPKGTMVTHRSLANAYFGWEREYELMTVARAHLQMANVAFDVFGGDLVRALCSGGKLVLCPSQHLLDAERLYTMMVQEQVTIAEFVPAVLRNLIDYLQRVGRRLDFMNVLIAGSDIWYAGEYKRFQSFVGPQTRVINSFGLTEATIDSTYFEASSLRLPDERLVPIGRPFPNSTIFLLDHELQPVPVGVTAEVFVGGAGLARAYHGRPDLTAEKFIPHRHATTPGDRLYRTGDLARYLPDGNIEFLGRKDLQVKVRGNRVELGEIETVIARYPDVHEGVVVARTDQSGNASLVAYVVPHDAGALRFEALRDFLRERVPDYMIPSAFVMLTALPLTSNGKVDRKALPVPDSSSIESGEAYVAPRTPIEESFVAIWRDILSVERVGVHDNFFLMGGHSLVATQLVSRVREQFEVELPLRMVFEKPTIADLAQAVETLRLSKGRVVAPPLLPVPRTDHMPLSFAQQRLWFLDQLEPDSPFYNLPEVYRLRGPLSVPILEQSFNEVVRRHEILRSSIATVDGGPVLHFEPALTISLSPVDLTGLPEEVQEEEIIRRAVAEAQRPLPLALCPLFRVSLLRLNGEHHIIVLIMHHIISDEWSANVLLREVSVLYGAFAHHQPSPLPELPLQYADFSAWQRGWLKGEKLESELEYWRQKLAGAPPVLELPTDRSRPPVQSFRGAYSTFLLTTEMSQAIRDLCEKEGVTLFMVLLAAFNVLLHRSTHQDDISLGTPIANRNRAEVEDLIGFFVNTLVIRTDLSRRPTFRQLLHRIRETALGAFAHQDVPFEMVVDALNPVRDLSHSPLFQVMFVLQNAASEKQQRELPGLTLTPIEAHSGTAKFDLTLFMVENGEEIGGAIEFCTDLFDASSIERMIEHFRQLLGSLVGDPDLPISTLTMMSDNEYRTIVDTWNATETPLDVSVSVVRMFESQAARAPDAPALLHGESSFTYAELNVRANQLAHYLRRNAVGPDVGVAICMNRVPDMVVAILGTLKAGGFYVPIDPAYPSARVAFMLRDSGVRMLLTQELLLERIQQPAVERTLALDSSWHVLGVDGEENPDISVAPDNLAYVIYTSGSTGTPKGVMVHHRGLLNYLTWCRKAYPLEAGRGAPVHSSISFDLTVTSILAPLAAGRTVELLSEDEGVETLAEALRRSGDYSLIKITPAHIEILAKQLAPEQAKDRTRAFIIGGENLLYESIGFWQKNALETVLVNEYGPTETVVGCCVHFVSRDERNGGSVPIGRPIINTQLYILDGEMHPVPVGVMGELHIGGAGVARGYLNRPDLTAERFIPNPFGTRTGDRLYKTGDVCVYRADGVIEYRGRNDDQVKIRGYRVELGEVEAAVNAHPAVQEAVVDARADEQGNRRLVAYLVWRDDAAIDIGELRRFLQKTMPDHLIPSMVIPLDHLPLTPNGKVDRGALPDPIHSRITQSETYVAPRNAFEETLAEIWRQILGMDRVGIHDDFFAMGGDSIQTIQVVSRATMAGIRLTPKLIFQHPTIAALAAVAESLPHVAAAQGLVTGPVPLTPIQQWFFDRSLVEPHHWNQSIILNVGEPIEPDLLVDIVRRLLMQHDALRLRYDHLEAGWQQRIGDIDDDTPVCHIDLSAVPREELQAAIETTAQDVQRSLNLSTGPVVRVAFLDSGTAETSRLLIVIHHLAIDAVSWTFLLEDFQVIFQALKSGRTPVLPPKTTSFLAWSNHLRDYSRSDALKEDEEFWVNIARQEFPVFPVDFPSGFNSEGSSRIIEVSLSVDETDALLRSLPRTHRTEINEVLLAAMMQALVRKFGLFRAMVDVENHGREEIVPGVDLSRTVGWFTSLVPVPLELTGHEEPLEALQCVKMQVRRIPKKGIGYGLLRYLSTQSESNKVLQRLPAPAVCLNYLGQTNVGGDTDTPDEIAKESSGWERGPNNERTHLIEVDGGIAGDRLSLQWSYSENVFQRSTVEDLAREFLGHLQKLIELSGTGESGSYEASDFAEFGWSEKDLSDIVSEINKSST